MTNAPKKVTLYLTLILAILGIILWLVGFLNVVPAFPYFELIGFVLLLIAWLLLTIAVSIKGL
jgi:hypothetical protein